MSLGDTLKALSDPTRREILDLLKEKPLTFGQIAEHFNMTQPAVSTHLKILRNAGLVDYTRVGTFFIYELNTTVFEDVLTWIKSLEMGGQRATSKKDSLAFVHSLSN
jgi:DNA-binding transcriptional ArsR family regulator